MSRTKKPRQTEAVYAPEASTGAHESAERIVGQGLEPIGRVIAVLGQYTDRLAEKLDGKDVDRDVASHYAWIAKMASQILTEVRKLGAAQRRELDRLSIEQVLAYVRTLSTDKRSHLARELATMDSGASVLS